MDDETVTRDLVPAFVKLLKDTEAEVRTAIAGQIPGNRGSSNCRRCADRIRILCIVGSGIASQRDYDKCGRSGIR